MRKQEPGWLRDARGRKFKNGRAKVATQLFLHCSNEGWTGLQIFFLKKTARA